MSESAAPRPRILIADDSDVCRTVLAILLKNTGFDVTSVVNGREALAKLREGRFDLAVLDNDMPQLDGLGTLAALRGFAPELPVVVVSGTLSPDLRAAYEKHGIERIWDKPVDPRKLRDQIPAILELRKRKAATGPADMGAADTPFQVAGVADPALEKPVFAGGSAQVRKLVGDFGRIRDFRSAAIISGGVGGGFLDLAVALAEEKEKEAVLLACAAEDVNGPHLKKLLAPALLQTRPVLLIVLNTESLGLEQQDLLEDFLRGAGELAGFNGRAKVILCAERSLVEMADEGAFNEMLLMRAGAMKLQVPRLADRRDDVQQIASAVLRRIGAATVKFTSEAWRWLGDSEWPGDYMQLHRVVDIAHRARPDAQELDLEDLEQARAVEPRWTQPLYHDVLLSTLGGK